MSLAPIILFTYNRPEHTARTVEALLRNTLANDSILYIYADGSRGERDDSSVAQTREYLKTIIGFKEIHITERTSNFGLAQSIITGVSEVLEKHESAIIVEDDLITSPYFLQYMNDGLVQYNSVEEVISIHGYSYPVKGNLPSTYFLKGADCWGWATWKRGWKLFEANGQKLLSEIDSRGLKEEFNFNNSFNYYKMLEKQVNGQNSSWAIRWYASAFLLNKLTLYPGNSMVHNIGNDNSGTHSKNLSVYDSEVANEPLRVGDISIIEDLHAKKIIGAYLRRNRIKLSILGAISIIRKKMKL